MQPVSAVTCAASRELQREVSVALSLCLEADVSDDRQGVETGNAERVVGAFGGVGVGRRARHDEPAAWSQDGGPMYLCGGVCPYAAAGSHEGRERTQSDQSR